jgi:hypothetical protein
MAGPHDSGTAAQIGGSGAAVNKYDVTVRELSRQNSGRATIGR